MCAHFAGATYGASKRALTLEVVLQVQHGGLVGGERTRLAMSGWAVMAPLKKFWPSTASMPVRERDRLLKRLIENFGIGGPVVLSMLIIYSWNPIK